jgi:hypothetical protein
MQTQPRGRLHLMNLRMKASLAKLINGATVDGQL